MSPNEFQLRDALREGEGDRPDPDAIIGRVLQLRYQRRRRFSAIAAAAAVVAVVGGGSTLLVRANSNTGSAGSNAANGPVPAQIHGVAPSARSNRSAPGSASSSVGGTSTGSGFGADARLCPRTLPQYVLPGGGGIGQFGSSEPLFATPVRTLTVCVFVSARTPFADAARLTGSAATSLANSLEHAPSTLDKPCTQVAVRPQFLAIVAVDASGKPEHTVTVALTCPYLATNGTAARYLDPAFAQSLRVDGPSGSGGVVQLTNPPSHPVGTPVK